MSRMAEGSDGFVYGYNNVSKVMEGFNLATGVLENSFSANLANTNLVSDGTLILGLNTLSGELEGYDVAGSRVVNFPVNWSLGTPIFIVPDIADVIYGYNALTSEVIGYVVSTGVLDSTAVVGFNPMVKKA